jgi:hypothetical protein
MAIPFLTAVALSTTRHCKCILSRCLRHSVQIDKRFRDFQGQVNKGFGDLGPRVTSLKNWMRWGVGIMLLNWLTLMTSIWLK